MKLVLAADRGRDSLLRDLTGPLEWGLLLESPFWLANCFPPLGTHVGLVGVQPWLSSLFEGTGGGFQSTGLPLLHLVCLHKCSAPVLACFEYQAPVASYRLNGITDM